MIEFNIELARTDLFDNFKIIDQKINIEGNYINKALLHEIEMRINKLLFEKELFKVKVGLSCSPYTIIYRSGYNDSLNLVHKYKAKILYILNYYGEQLTKEEIELDDFLM